MTVYMNTEKINLLSGDKSHSIDHVTSPVIDQVICLHDFWQWIYTFLVVPDVSTVLVPLLREAKMNLTL